MGEDDIVEILWKSGHVVRSSQAQRPTLVPPPPPFVLRGSGSGGGRGVEEIPPLQPLLQSQQQQPSDDQNLFIREDEMASWLHHHPPLVEDEFPSHHLLYPALLVSPPFTQLQGSVSLTPPLPPPPPPPPASERPIGQVLAENFINFSSLRVEAAAAGAPPWVPIVRGSSATPTSSLSESCPTPVTITGGVGVGHTFAVPRAFCDMAGPSSAVPFQVQLATETEAAEDERKRKEREETAAAADNTEETGEEEARASASRKRSRATELHNISERKRREKINEKMRTLQELIPRCNKTDKASMLDDAIEYVKALQMQIQMMSTGMPMMYTPNMQRFMPPSAMGMMGVNQPPFIPPFPGRPFPRPAHVAGLPPPPPPPPYPFAFDPSRVPNQPQFPGYFNPYSQFVGLQQMQQPLPLPPPPPPLQNQTRAQLSLGQASSSKESQDQENKPTG